MSRGNKGYTLVTPSRPVLFVTCVWWFGDIGRSPFHELVHLRAGSFQRTIESNLISKIQSLRLRRMNRDGWRQQVGPRIKISNIHLVNYTHTETITREYRCVPFYSHLGTDDGSCSEVCSWFLIARGDSTSGTRHMQIKAMWTSRLMLARLYLESRRYWDQRFHSIHLGLFPQQLTISPIPRHWAHCMQYLKTEKNKIEHWRADDRWSEHRKYSPVNWPSCSTNVSTSSVLIGIKPC